MSSSPPQPPVEKRLAFYYCRPRNSQITKITRYFHLSDKSSRSDQFRNLQPLLEYFGKNKIQAGIYDGILRSTKEVELEVAPISFLLTLI